MKIDLRKQWPILLVLMLAFLMRLPLLNGSFWLDEAAQAMESVRPLSQQLNIVDDFQSPLLHLLVHFEMYVSHTEWWLRFGAALIPGIITVWATYEIGRRLFSKNIGLLAALFLATSSFHIFYSQELRPYALPAMLAALSWLVIVRAKKFLLPFILLSIAGFYTSYLYPFLFAGQCVYLFFCQPQLRKQLFFSVAAIGVSFLPWLPMFLAQLHAGQALRIDLPGWEKVVSFDQVKSLLLVYGKFVFGVLDLGVNAKFLLLSAIFCGLAAVLFWGIWKKKKANLAAEWKKLSLLLSWLVLPILAAWLISFVVPIVQPKRVLFCLPAFDLILAYLIGNTFEKFEKLSFKSILKKKSPNVFVFAAVALGILILSLNLFSTFSYYTQPKYQREDWKSLHKLIVTKYPKAESVVVFAFPAPFAPWQWYDDGSFPTFATGVLTTKKLTNDQEFKKLTDYRYILVFDYLRDLTDPDNRVVTNLQSYGYQEVDRITPKTELGFVRVFTRKDATLGMR